MTRMLQRISLPRRRFGFAIASPHPTLIIMDAALPL